MIGTWLTMVATSWLVYRLARESGQSPGDAAFILGVVGFASQAPQLLLAPVAGVWVDRLNRHSVLVVTQALSMVQSFLLAALALTHHITIPWIVVLNTFQGFVNAFDIPARQSLTVDLVEKREDLGNAIALSSSMVHAARFIGPALAGFLIYKFGEGSCFLIDGFSFFAVLIALTRMKIKKAEKIKSSAKVLESFKEGLNYAWTFTPIRALLLFIAATSLFTMSLQVLLPVFSESVLGGGERIYGFLLCGSGFGALLGTLYLASRKSVVGLGRISLRANVILGLGLIGFTFAHSFLASIFFCVITGCAMIIQIAAGNTILQTIVDDSMRGRIMSLFAVAFMGTMPLGSLLAGELARRVGTSLTFGISGAACLICSYIFGQSLPRMRKHVTPIYIKLGLLPFE